MVALKKDHGLGANTILHNAVIIAQFLKRHGRSGITRELQLPERITSLPKEYREGDLARFFAACYDAERALFSTFLLTGFREQEVMYLFWSDINLDLRTVRVTAKPGLGFYPKRWEEREVPAPSELIAQLSEHSRRPNCAFVFPSPTGNREQHMLDRAKAVALPGGLDPAKFDSRLSGRRTQRGCCERASTYERFSIGWVTNHWRLPCAIWFPPLMFTAGWTK